MIWKNTLIIKPPKGISLESAKAALLNLNFGIINHPDMYYDFSDDLSEEDLHLVEISKQQAEMGMLVDSADVHRKARERKYENKMVYTS